MYSIRIASVLKNFLFPFFIFLFILNIFLIPLAFAETLLSKDVPEPLKPWIKWVLRGQDEKFCPFVYRSVNEQYCRWPSKLDLALDRHGGQFVQSWLMFDNGWVPLPGDSRLWPQDVMIDGIQVVVVENNSVPGAYLAKGSHTLSGTFSWENLPESLAIPPETGIVRLTLNGQDVLFPDIDDQGRLWLRKRKGRKKNGMDDTLAMKVHRRIIDEIPLRILIHIEINISGRRREVVLGKAITDKDIPMSLKSPIPAILSPDGRLRIQARPGKWIINLEVRRDGPVYSISFEAPEAHWPQEEVWVFDARNHLRMVTIEGLVALDPRQTTLPPQWQGLPAFRVQSGDTMKIVEKKRGDPEPAPDQLTLNRSLWLDFDGKGYTVQDTITGTKSSDWRLEMNPPIIPGQVVVDGESRFITRLKGSDRAGVEVRQGQINLTADSRIKDNVSRFPIAGWNQSFQKVTALLHLPPGWSLFDTSGVDYVSDTWLNRWTLLDLFVVLIIALGFSRLWGKKWGALALVTLALLYHEPGAPRWIWLHLLAAIALLHVLPENRFRNVIRIYALLSMLVLVIIAVPFMVNQVREGLFPQLEKPWQIINGYPQTAPSAVQTQMEQEAVQMESPESGQFEQSSYDRLNSFTRYKKAAPTEKQIVQQYDPQATIQTGPGLPKWKWKTIHLRWNGPVESDQQISLMFLSPNVKMALNFVRVILIALLTVLLLGKFDLLKYVRKPAKSISAVFIFFMLLPTPKAMADIPSQEILKQLQEALLEKPECFPQCASSPRLFLEIHDNTLTAMMEIHSVADTAVPLPGNEKQWLPSQVFLNGSPEAGLIRTKDGQLLINVFKGIFQVVMKGPLPNRDTVQIALPLKPGRVSVQSQGWTVEGIYENGVAADNLQLNRIVQDDSQTVVQETANFPPFVQIERTLLLGLTWAVETRITRMTPKGTAVVIEVPLLSGESVITEGVRVKNGKVQVNMAPNQTKTYWQSVYKTQDKITLTAPQTTLWTEVWRLDVSPVWHVDIKGIPVIHHQDNKGHWMPTWRPWPGESVTLTVSRPKGVTGQTVTVDSSTLVITPGQRTTEAELTLIVRSSHGDQKNVVLPQDAELQSVYIDGTEQPIRQEDHSVTLPLVPGTQTFKLLWRQKAGIETSFSTPSVDLKIPSVNNEIELKMSSDRWTLLTSGPQVGPAVLFWGVLIIIVLLSILLGRVQITPLKWYHWFLLFIGLSQIPIELAIFAALWLLALGLRKKSAPAANRFLFDAIQIGLVLLTAISLGALIYAIQHGLLGHPDMQIQGNGSSNTLMRWYKDRVDSRLSQGWVFSVPLKVYRAAMLAWALWIASSLLNWLRWGWHCFSEHGLWQPLRLFRQKKEGI